MTYSSAGRPLSVAEYFHQQTKYAQETMASLEPVDFQEQPVPFKDYHCTHPIDLVPFLPFQEFPLQPDEGQEPVPPETLSEVVGALSRILYFTNGATGISRGPDGVHIFRSAPSAGALYPTEIYLALRDIDGVTDGLYNYSVRLHQLALVFEGDFIEPLEGACWNHPSFEGAQVVAVLTGLYRRSTWRYHDRAYRRILLDTGHVLGNLCLAAREEGYQAIPLTDFHDPTLTGLFFLDPKEEGTLLVAPIVAESGIAAQGKLPSAPRRSPRTSAPPADDLPLYLACHQGGEFASGNPPVVTPLVEDRHSPGVGRPGIPLTDRLETLAGQFPSTVIRRRSTRTFSGAPLDIAEVAKVLDFGHRSRASISPATANPFHDAADDPSPTGADLSVLLPSEALLSTHLVSNRVNGLAAGAYRYHTSDHQLVATVEGDLRGDSLHSCLGQALVGDAAALVIHSADLNAAVEILGDRAYRYLHMEAGFIGQKMNLAATYLQVGVSGIGGFFDDEINALLSIEAREAIIYITVLGQPLQ